MGWGSEMRDPASRLEKLISDPEPGMIKAQDPDQTTMFSLYPFASIIPFFTFNLIRVLCSHL
jgi:hypothetical protein